MDLNAFWKRLCTDLNYRFFTGVPNEELYFLFNTLDKTVLHYVPTVMDVAAVGLASGARLNGFKSVVICNKLTFDLASDQIKGVSLLHNVPILYITTDTNNPFKFKLLEYNNTPDVLNTLDDYILTTNRSAILLVKE